jgi:hypothetical protein
VTRALLLAGAILAVATPALALNPQPLPPGIYLNPQPLPPRIAPGGAHNLSFVEIPHGQLRTCRLAMCQR